MLAGIVIAHNHLAKLLKEHAQASIRCIDPFSDFIFTAFDADVAERTHKLHARLARRALPDLGHKRRAICIMTDCQRSSINTLPRL